MVRRNSTPEHQGTRIDHLTKNGDVITEYGDMTDKSAIDRILKEYQPDEIYNIAAQSHVRISFDLPVFTVETNALGVINLLESYKQIAQRQGSIKLRPLKCLEIILMMTNFKERPLNGSNQPIRLCKVVRL